IWAWDVATRKVIWKVTGQKGAICSVDFSGDGRMVASGGLLGEVCLWEAQTGKLVHKMSGHRDEVKSLCFSPDGSVLASSDRAKSIRIWEPISRKQIALIAESGDCIAFSPDSRLLAV